MTEPAADLVTTFDGGTEADREALLAVHHAFLAANDTLDFAALSRVWDASPSNRFFNTNGHTYRGLADWESIWDFYRPQFRLFSAYTPGNVSIVVRGDMAMIAADRIARHKEWIGHTDAHNPPYYRATQVCVRSADGEWRVVHAHFSTEAEGTRPDLAERS